MPLSVSKCFPSGTAKSAERAGKEKGGEAARWENPPLKGGMSPKATGGKTKACFPITIESHEQTSINHPIRQLR